MTRSIRFLAIAVTLCVLSTGAATGQETMYALKTQAYGYSTYPSEIEIVDLSTLTSTGSFSLGSRAVMSLAVAPDQSTLYVADFWDGGQVGVYTTGGSFLTDISLPGARDLVLSDDGSKLYAVSTQYISEIDIATRTVTRSTPLIGAHIGVSIALSPDGSTLAVCSTYLSTGSIYLVDTTTMAINTTITVAKPGGENGAYGDVTFIDDTRLLMYDNNYDMLYQFDVNAGTQVTAGTIAMTIDYASSVNINNALCYSSVSQRAYVHRDSPDEMYIFDPAAGTGTTLGGFTEGPFVSALSTDDSRLYMASYVGSLGTADQMSLLDVSTGALNYGVFSFGDTAMHVRDMVIMPPPPKHWASAAGGLWDVAGNWSPVGAPGSGVATWVDPALGVTITGPAGATSVGSLTIGATSAGIASLELQASGPLTATGPVQITSKGRLAGTGILNAQGGITNDGVIDLDDGLQLVGGTLTNRGILFGGGVVGNALSNGADGQVRVAAGEWMVFTAAAANSGKIEVLGGDVEFVAGLNNQGAVFARNGVLRFGTGLANNGSVGISFGVTDVFGDVTNKSAGQVVVSGGASVTFYDDVFNDGEIRVSPGGSAVFFGSFSGANGTTGPGAIYMEGDLRPGHSPAVITFGGDVVFGSGAGLEVEIEGSGTGEFDRVEIAGAASLSGLLDVLVADGYVPEPGTAFEVLTCGSLQGQFNHQGLENVAGYPGLWFRANYGPDSLSLLASALTGDGNLDGRVGLSDLAMLADNYGMAGGATWWHADFNDDGNVGLADLAALADNYGNRIAGASVPEPAALALLAMGTLALGRRRRAGPVQNGTHCPGKRSRRSDP